MMSGLESCFESLMLKPVNQEDAICGDLTHFLAITNAICVSNAKLREQFGDNQL